MSSVPPPPQAFEPGDFWRAIVLYGLNTATYKIALARALVGFVEVGRTSVPMATLAESFLDLYQERLTQNKPQLLLAGRQTVMERVVGLLRAGRIERGGAIDRVAREAFGDVLPRFHTVWDQAVPVRFYEQTDSGLVITDDAFRVLAQGDRPALLAELDGRWSLLEGAFQMRRDDSALVNDVRSFYLARGTDRTDLTHLRPVLDGYQNGVCFYCGEPFGTARVDVDHVVPRQVLLHDDVWNLVLAHHGCNQAKSDFLPGLTYLQKLVERNEHFIASNHPIKDKLIQQLGSTPDQRRAAARRAYADAEAVIRHTWEGMRGYRPDADPFYRAFVRTMI